MLIKNILLNTLAIVAIISSVLVITAKNPVISVLYLISVFINTAGYLIVLGIGFVGIAYILVYIGAITVLFLFVIMMINIKLVDILEVGKEYTKNLPLALSIGFVFLYLIISISSSYASYDTNYSLLGNLDSLSKEFQAPAYAAYASDVVEGGLNNISLNILTYPLEILTNLNKLFLIFGTVPESVGGVEYLNESTYHNFVSIIDSILNPIGQDINFVNFLQIEMLGQGLYTYGAY